jgi:glycosyltransferase involved in cell wall biosynthesis
MEVERWQSGPSPHISVVIPTIPSNTVDGLVAELKNQQFTGDWEIIIVVDGAPTDRRCEARNVGIREAEGEIVAHTDDDVSPPSEWLARIDEVFAQDVICLEGRVCGGMNYAGEGLYRGCNMAVRRDEALRVGGWNEEYVGWRDDTEFGWRLEEKGNGRCIYRDDVVMTHPPNPRTSVKMDQEIQIYNTYPEKYRKRIPYSVKKIVFIAMCRRRGGQRLLRALATASSLTT